MIALLCLCVRDNRIAVRFAYEWHDDSGNWFRSYGNENWEFDEEGLMRWRIASINDLPIKDSERKYHWLLGRRPADHPSLSSLGLLDGDTPTSMQINCRSFATDKKRS
jgi:nuclear transport factor 2 (NTF2) superfamily protein